MKSKWACSCQQLAAYLQALLDWQFFCVKVWKAPHLAHGSMAMHHA